MKKIIGLTIFVLGISIGSVNAQEKEVKSKSTTTTRDKVHNVFHPRHKWHHAYKYKRVYGRHKRKVRVSPNHTEIKNQ